MESELSVCVNIVIFSFHCITYVHSKQMALIPVLDMLNHSATVEVMMLLLIMVVLYYTHCFPCSL